VASVAVVASVEVVAAVAPAASVVVVAELAAGASVGASVGAAAGASVGASVAAAAGAAGAGVGCPPPQAASTRATTVSADSRSISLLRIQDLLYCNCVYLVEG